MAMCLAMTAFATSPVHNTGPKFDTSLVKQEVQTISQAVEFNMVETQAYNFQAVNAANFEFATSFKADLSSLTLFTDNRSKPRMFYERICKNTLSDSFNKPNSDISYRTNKENYKNKVKHSNKQRTEKPLITIRDKISWC